jgi:hypothetical protein
MLKRKDKKFEFKASTKLRKPSFQNASAELRGNSKKESAPNEGNDNLYPNASAQMESQSEGPQHDSDGGDSSQEQSFYLE